MEREAAFKDLKIRGLIMWNVLIFIFSIILLSILSGIFGTSLLMPIEYVVTSLEIYVISLIWIFYQLRKRNLKLNYVIGPPPSKYGWKGIAGIVVLMIVFSLGAMYMVYYPLSFVFPSFIESILNTPDYYQTDNASLQLFYKIFDFIVAVLAAPIVEEIVFRGILLHRFSVKWNTRRAIIISSILFGLLHLDPVGAFVFGIFMSILYVKTKSLIIPIICHALNNVIASGMTLLSSSEQAPQEFYSITQFQSEVWFGIVCLCISVPFIIRYLWKRWPKKTWMLPYYAPKNDSQEQTVVCG